MHFSIALNLLSFPLQILKYNLLKRLMYSPLLTVKKDPSPTEGASLWEKGLDI